MTSEETISRNKSGGENYDCKKKKRESRTNRWKSAVGHSAGDDKYKYLGLVVNIEGNLKDHIPELGQKKSKKFKKILEINAIGAKNQVGTEEIAVKLKLFELWLMPAMQYWLAAWRRILTREPDKIEIMQSKALKQLLQVPISKLMNYKSTNGDSIITQWV